LIEVFNIQEGLFFGILDLKAFSLQHQEVSNREIETLGKNFLLAHLTSDTTQLIYDDKGKPHLANDSRHLSISHSHDRLVIIINEKEETGIDIELLRDKVLKIKHKFLSISELSDANDDVEKLLIYWAAKETLYKIYGLKEVDFIKHLAVDPFMKQTHGKLNGFINLSNFNASFELNYQLVDNYALVYALKKITDC
jgi:4'-phosphopantetheinyl transferase